MALTDTLRGRAALRGGTAQVDCGELGVLTVEALSPADCARLGGERRALLYAACRELQMAGEELRSEGKIFRPDEIMVYITDDEADAAARTILELSGFGGDSLYADGILSGIRLQSVQVAEGEIRPQSVQTLPEGLATAGALWDADAEIRLSPVQTSGDIVTENGQVSRESASEDAAFSAGIHADKKSQILGDLSSRTAQILVSKKGEDYERRFPEAAADVSLHEIKSESRRQGRGSLHETESEFRGKRQMDLHETTSDFGGRRGILLHETESESGWLMHEIKSELQKGLHEIKSEVREMLHEIESELPEAAAQRLAEGILRAGQVR